MNPSEMRAISMIKQVGGMIHTAEALNRGVHPRTLYTLRDKGVLTPISRGIYRLSEMKPVSNPDLVTVASRAPNAVICLISALSFHKMTTQIPHTISIAIGTNSSAPKIHYPPITAHRFSDESFKAGVENHTIDGVGIQIYSTEKTLADCFKYRNQIGIDICIEALKFYKFANKINVEKIIEYAKICRVYKIMVPFLESIL